MRGKTQGGDVVSKVNSRVLSGDENNISDRKNKLRMVQKVHTSLQI